MLWPMIVVVVANTLYNIFAKSTPDNVNAFLTLFVTYAFAAAVSFSVFLITKKTAMSDEISRVNWTALAFGASIVMLEVGYIFIYRAGWKVSTASLVANISLACVLLFVGYFLYREVLTPRQLIGIAVCISGLLLITI